MALFWGFLMVLMALSYILAERMFGREVVRRSLFYIIIYFLWGLALAFVIPKLRKYSWENWFYILCPVVISAWLLSCFLCKKEAGTLLCHLGRISQGKPLFWMGLFQAGVAVIQTCLCFYSVLNGQISNTSLELSVYQVVSHWFFVCYFMTLGLSKVEFREKGICFMHSLLKWNKVSSYAWQQSNPNILIIRLKSDTLPSLKQRSIIIPAKYKDVVSNILDNKLSGKLASTHLQSFVKSE